MKRLILAAVAASILALPTVQTAQAGPKETYGHSTQWKKHGPRKEVQTRRNVQVHKDVHVQKKVVVRKAGPQWRKGQKFAAWKRHQAVRDFNRHGLRRPAYGQEWIRVGNDYLLVSIASGLIFGAIAAR
jgi:Ni/Co efflux regulator RcnB